MIRAILGLAGLTLRTFGSGRRAAAAAFLLGLPPVLALVAALAPEARAPEVFRQIVFYVTLWFVVYLLGVIYGLSLSSGEIEDGTAGYLFLSALPRWLTVLVQAGVTAAALGALLGASLLLTALAARAAGGPFPALARDVGVCTLAGGAGIVIALGYAMTCGFAFRHPRGAMTAAVAPVFFWELMVTWWPVKFAAYTVTNNVRAVLRTLLFEGRPGRVFKYVRNFELPEYAEASVFLSALAGLALAAAMVAAMNRSIEGKEAR
jgi:ABC-type transport system involved in multi-copper enzyme maturation permease subunit